MNDQTDEQFAHGLISDDVFQAKLLSLARGHLPSPDGGGSVVHPQLFAVSLQPSAVIGEAELDVIDLERSIGRGDSYCASYLHSIGRTLARNKRFVVAAFLLRETALDDVVAQTAGIVGPAASVDLAPSYPIRKVALLLGLTLDGRLAGISSLIERDENDRLLYCAEHTPLDGAERARLGAAGIAQLQQFWRGFMEVVVDRLSDPSRALPSTRASGE